MTESLDLVQVIKNKMKQRPIRSLGGSPTLYPSQASALASDGSIIGKCMRSAYYEKTGVTKTNPVDEAVSLMAYMGNQIEDGLTDICKDIGLWAANSVKFRDDLISGEIDVILRVPGFFNKDGKWTDEYLINVECKSCSGYYINKEVYGYWSGRGANRTKVPGRPKDAHLMQSAIYADKTRDNPGCKGTIIIYFSRDESKMTQFHIVVTPEGLIYIDGILDDRFTMEDMYKRYRTLKGHIDRAEMPPMEFKHTYSDLEVKTLHDTKVVSKSAYDTHCNGKRPYRDQQCNYCGHRDLCVALTAATLVATVVEEKTPDSITYGSF